MPATGVVGARLAMVGVALVAGSSVASAQPADSGIVLRVPAQPLRAVDGVLIDLDASALRNPSNLRVVVVPAGTPDAIDDPNLLAAVSTRVTASGRVRMTLPPGPPGADEVRLYYVPQLSTAYAVAARAPIQVQPGVAGAVLPSDLGREAFLLGPLRFEAQYRDNPVRVQAQFLRVRPDTDWDVHWFGGLPLASSRQVAVISIGVRGSVHGVAAIEAVCPLDVTNPASLRRIAALSPGDAVLVQGEPTTWSAATAADPIPLRGCSLLSPP